MRVLDFSEELQLVRYRNGVKLVEPMRSAKNTNLQHTVQSIKQLPFAIYFDNGDGKTVTCNEISAEECGFESVTAMQGKPWYQYFKEKTLTQPFSHVNDTLRNEMMKVSYENAERNDGSCNDVFSIRMPWYDANNMLQGLFGCAIIIGKNALAESLNHISALGLLNSNQTIQAQQSIGSEIGTVYLSKREWECLHLTVRGKTAKQIAATLNLSKWTVEEYLANIKIKLNVSSKAELVDKTIDYLYHKQINELQRS